MKKTRLSDSYRLINLLFIGIIALIIAYSAIFSDESDRYPVPSGSAIFGSADTTISTGLSRSFSSIVRLNFRKAEQYNPYGIRLFSFFIIQLCMRASVLLMPFHKWRIREKSLVLTDTIVSAALFIVFFLPFLTQTFRQISVIFRG